MNREGEAWGDSLQEAAHLGELEPWRSYRQGEGGGGARLLYL